MSQEMKEISVAGLLAILLLGVAFVGAKECSTQHNADERARMVTCAESCGERGPIVNDSNSHPSCVCR